MRLGEAREVLGLTAASTPEDARRAYRRLALTAHPDKNSSPDATERFQRIQVPNYALGRVWLDSARACRWARPGRAFVTRAPRIGWVWGPLSLAPHHP
jgi:hypothetical protein